MNRDAYQLQGQNGGIVIADTILHTGDWSFLMVANDAVIDTIETSLEDQSGLEGITLPAGFPIGGKTRTLQLVSGVVIAYN